MPRFPSSFIDDLKASADIVQVIQDVVPLKKAGASYKGLCPFHTEKTPSFHVNRDKGFFHCFGCDTGGDVVKFVELYDKLSFPEAVRTLAQRFGLTVPESDDPERDRQVAAERETLLRIHEVALAFFRERLTQAIGTHARTYLERRGIQSETVDRLGFGFAPPHRDALTRHLLEAGHTLPLLLKSGLMVARESGPPVDRFRNRLMIPIHRDTGSVVAFGGRALADDQRPKYVNSPETALYTKGRLLYGLHAAKADVRRLGYVVLVEGYFDLAQALQAGVTAVVATCGTALTDRQARLLRRFCGKTLLSFDPDAAGQGASARSGELLLAEGFDVNVVELAPGEDPDTYIRRHGAEKYRAALTSSVRYVDYVIERAAAARDLTRDHDRREFVADMLTVANRMPDLAARQQFADRLALRAGIMADVVRAQIRRAAVERRTDALVAIPTMPTLLPAEKGLIWATMRETVAAQSVLSGLEPDDFEGLAGAPILHVARTLTDVPAAGVRRDAASTAGPRGGRAGRTHRHRRAARAQGRGLRRHASVAPTRAGAGRAPRRDRSPPTGRHRASAVRARRARDPSAPGATTTRRAARLTGRCRQRQRGREVT